MRAVLCLLVPLALASFSPSAAADPCLGDPATLTACVWADAATRTAGADACLGERDGAACAPGNDVIIIWPFITAGPSGGDGGLDAEACTPDGASCQRAGGGVVISWPFCVAGGGPDVACSAEACVHVASGAAECRAGGNIVVVWPSCAATATADAALVGCQGIVDVCVPDGPSCAPVCGSGSLPACPEGDGAGGLDPNPPPGVWCEWQYVVYPNGSVQYVKHCTHS